MRFAPRRPRLVATALVAWLALVAALLVPQLRQAETAAAQECPPGTRLASEVRDAVAPDEAANLPAQYRGFQDIDPPDVLAKVACVSDNAPEAFQDMALRDRQWNAARTAPFASVAEGANSAAAAQRQQMLAQPADVPGADGTFEQYGEGPLVFDDPRFNEGQIAQLGLVDATGRIDDLKFDEPTGQLFAAIGTGGIWRSMDLGDSWESISDSLPAAVVGAVAYSSAGGEQGTILTVTGEHTFGGNAYTGIGAYYSRDDGATWLKSDGVPDGALGFAIEVDPNDPNIVYAATQDGLFRSTDAGVSYTNVDLPTSPDDDDPNTPECTGVTRSENNDQCNFANMVTDVTLKAPGGVGEAGTRVIAAVGWRAGMMQNPDPDGDGPTEGSIQSPNNGVYGSETGAPGSFERLPGLDGPVGGRENIGRIEFGPTVGPEQDHDFLYAIVEDAVLFNGGVPGIDAGDPVGAPNLPNSLSGIYVSDDFGTSWTQVESDNEISQGCAATGSALCIPGLIQPGVQAWYDLWIAPDPSVQDGAVPSRVVFGIEEIWQNVRGVAAGDIAVEEAVDGPETAFEVFGRYFSGNTCAFGLIPVPGEACPTSRPPAGTTTTHPDQHAGIFVPNGAGAGMSLLVGHDGGFSRQDFDPNIGEELNNGAWELDQNNGLQTLLSYSAVIANDGVAWAGLQDNGHMKLEPENGFAQFETFGGDGTFAAVDPENSDYAFESVQGGRMNVTVDGGLNWRSVVPPAQSKRFVNPFVMDPLNSNHIATGGRQINETLAGPDVTSGDGNNDNGGAPTDWVTVFDLGTVGAQDEEPAEDANITVNNGMSAIDTRGDVTYVGFCGACDILNSDQPFRRGIATNLAGTDGEAPQAATPAGWGFVPAEGLPNRFITNVTIDPEDPSGRTVYVALGGYSRRWVPPGSVGDANPDIGEGHIFKSTDAGQTFTDISGDLPDIPAAWIEPRGNQLIVGTDNGVYISSDTEGGPYAVLGGDQLPAVPVTSLQLKADDPNTLLVGTYGRSLMLYTFPTEQPTEQPTDQPTPGPTPPVEPPVTDPAEVRRVAGPDRVQTAIETSQELFADGSADAVVLARGDDYADALAGAPFARSVNAPVLLTPSDQLGDGVAEEIARLGAGTAHLLGGTEAISGEVAAELEQAGLTVERIGGTNRYDTSRLLAEELGGTEVYVAQGFDEDPARGWPDALAVAPLAAAQGRPILLVDTDDVPEETAQAVESLGVQRATVVGGTGAVTQSTQDQLGVETNRVGGETRFETSAQIAGLAEEAGQSFANTWLSRGSNWPDALSSGPTVAASGGILLLVGDNDLDESPPTRDLLQSNVCEIELLRILGGTQAISGGVEQQARDLVNGATCTE